jgi:hypothetical protein
LSPLDEPALALCLILIFSLKSLAGGRLDLLYELPFLMRLPNSAELTDSSLLNIPSVMGSSTLDLKFPVALMQRFY